jgi:hypothetical protein
MSLRSEQPGSPVLTASLTTNVARVACGIRESKSLIDEVLKLDHIKWETTLMVGAVEFHQTRDGPFPDHQMRVSVRPSVGYAALNYTDNEDPEMSIANSYSPSHPPVGIYLIFSGAAGSVFPPSAAVRIADARNALNEWLRTRRRPTCIQWARYDYY